MAGFKLAEMQGRADVDAVMRETPFWLLAEWVGWWQLQHPDKSDPHEADHTPMTPEKAAATTDRMRKLFGSLRKREVH